MVVEKPEPERAHSWFPEIFFYMDSGREFLHVDQNKVGDLYHSLINMNDGDQKTDTSESPISLIPSGSILLIKGLDGWLKINYYDQVEARSRITIDQKGAAEITNALESLG